MCAWRAPIWLPHGSKLLLELRCGTVWWALELRWMWQGRRQAWVCLLARRSLLRGDWSSAPSVPLPICWAPPSRFVFVLSLFTCVQVARPCPNWSARRCTVLPLSNRTLTASPCTLQVLLPLSTAPGTLSADQLYLCEAALVTLTYALQLLFQHLTALAVSAREAGRASAQAQELLCAAVEDREHLLESARQMALLLHAPTDGGAAGIQGRRPSQDGVDGPILIHNALAALQYSTVLLLVLYEADRLRGLAPSALFAQSAEGAGRVLETAELLVRFVGKRPGLGERLTAMLGPQPLAAQHTGASEVLLSLATEMVRDLLAAPAALIPAGSPAAAQRALRRVRSLAASAAKLLRCMPSIPAMETRGGGRHHWAQCVMERITELACALLVQQPGLVPDPGEQLTEHLRWGP